MFKTFCKIYIMSFCFSNKLILFEDPTRWITWEAKLSNFTECFKIKFNFSLSVFFSGFKHYLFIINVSCLRIKPDEFPQEAKLHINFTDCFKIKLNFSLADLSGLCVIYLFSLKQEKVVKEVRKINAIKYIISI